MDKSMKDNHQLDDSHTHGNCAITIPREIRKIRPWVWLFWLVVDWGVIVATYSVFAVYRSWWLLPVAVLIIGTRQHALGLLGHDATHRRAFKNRRLNDIFGDLFTTWPLWIVLGDAYRDWHFGHHRELGSANDPELDYRGGSPYSGHVSWLSIGRCFLFDLFGLGVLDLLNVLRLVFPYRNPARYLGPISLWIATALLLLAFGQLWILGVWALSLVTAFWAVFRVRAFTEHVAVDWNGHASSHRFRAGWIARFLFFPHNTWCHFEHHKYPQVPFYNLPALRKLDGTKPTVHFLRLFPLFGSHKNPRARADEAVLPSGTV
jgi:fatty acid desaturase